MQAHGFEQQLVGDWRGDLGMLLPQTGEPAITRRLRRSRRADLVRTVAPLVGFVGAGDLHLRRRLIGDAEAVVVLLPLVDSWRRRRHVEPLVGLEGVGIREDAGLALDLVVPRREPEPDLVAADRTAEGFVEV